MGKKNVFENVSGGGTEKGEAYGFTLDSFSKLINTRGVDKKTSLLDYVVKNLYDKEEQEILDVIQEFKILDECCSKKLSASDVKRDFEQVLNIIQRLNAAYDSSSKTNNTSTESDSAKSPLNETKSPIAKILSSKYVGNLKTFVSNVNEKVAELKTWKDLLSAKHTEIVDYFGEESDHSCDTIKVFTVMQEFKKALAFSKQAIEWKIQRSNQ